MNKITSSVLPDPASEISPPGFRLVLLWTLIGLGLLLVSSSLAASSSIVISQVYGGGGNSGATYKNDFIELFNRGSVAADLTGWSVQYTSSTGGTWQVTSLSGTIHPGQHFLVQEAAGSGGTSNLPTPDILGTIAMSGSAGKVVVVSQTAALTGTCPSGTHIVDRVGFGSSANCYEGVGPAPAPGNTTSILRKSGGCTDTDNNVSDFTTGTPMPRNTSSPIELCSGPTSPTGAGSASPSTLAAGGTSLLTVNVVPGANPTSTGINVTADLQSIGGLATQFLFDDGSHGDVSAEDLVYSFRATIPTGASPGVKDFLITISDSQGRSGNITISLAVESAPLAIHDIQGAGPTSPHAGEVVTTEGVVTALKNNGFFLQTPEDKVDSDPATSEGIFVFTGSPLPVAAVVGNRVIVTGTVHEFIPPSDPHSPSMTEIRGFPTVSLVSSGNPLPVPILLTTALSSPAGGFEQLERFEGMRVTVDSLTVVSPTQGLLDEVDATAVSSGVFFGVIDGNSRPMREPGIDILNPLPVGAPCCIPRFDGNPERLRVESTGQPGGLAIEASAGSLLGQVTGPLDYAFRTYTILPDTASPPTVPSMQTAIPLPAPRPNEFTIASFNLRRFYDTNDDALLEEPVPTSAAFIHRITKISLAIRNILRSPDFIGVQEVENLGVLQSLADQINHDAIEAGDTNPGYRAFLIEGNDSGGVDVGALVKISRVNVLDVVQHGRDATYINPLTGGRELLHDRPPLLLRVEIKSPGGAAYPMTLIVNHLRSFSGIDDAVDGPRVRSKRRAQAEFLASLIQGRQTIDPNEHLVLLGDFNSYPFNDGFVDVLGIIQGKPASSDQTLLPGDDLVNPDLLNLLQRLPPDQQYSYVFDGNAQALDHILISQNLSERVQRFLFARCNADFPESMQNDATRPERTSDHDIPVAYFSFPEASTDLSVTMTVPGNPVVAGSNLDYAITVVNNGPADASEIIVGDVLPSQLLPVSCTATAGGVCGGATNNRTIVFPFLGAGASAVIHLVAATSCALTDGSFITNSVTVTSGTLEANPANNSITKTVAISNPAPVIACPSDLFSLTSAAGASSQTVHFGMPTVNDNCPVVNTTCTPGPGSRFAVGTTAVSCSSTDSGSRSSTCKFVVTLHNVCLKDDRQALVFSVDSGTGDYRLIRCQDGLVVEGRGQIVEIPGSCYFSLQDSRPDRRVLGKLNRCEFSGMAVVQLAMPPALLTISDWNPRGDCSCH